MPINKKSITMNFKTVKKILVLFTIVFSNATINAQEITFGQQIGNLLYQMTLEKPDTLKIQKTLKLLNIDNKEVKFSNLGYSIYDDFEGDRLYYLPFTKADESRFTVEQLKKENKLYYTAQFLLKSSYTINSQGKIKFDIKDYKYNVSYEDLIPFCTTPMKYKNGNGNNPTSSLLSCIYTNPDSQKRMMYWVVFENPIGTKTGNTVKEIKFQSIELWQK